MHVAALWRYPVKSMQGERVDAVDVGSGGVAGDRAYAVVDIETGKVASAKVPQRFGPLLQCSAATDGDRVVMSLPGGAQVDASDPDAGARLSAFLGRPVRLAAQAEAGASAGYEADWPEEAQAPQGFLEAMGIDGAQPGFSRTALPTAPGSFLDLAPIHVLTTATLRYLGSVSESRFDTRRFRPNIVVELEADGFVENTWVGCDLRAGGAVIRPTLPTMRCVMTTLAQPDLPADRGVLRTVAANNRVKIPGSGMWSCAGAYADVATAGVVRTGDEVALVTPS